MASYFIYWFYLDDDIHKYLEKSINCTGQIRSVECNAKVLQTIYTY